MEEKERKNIDACNSLLLNNGVNKKKNMTATSQQELRSFKRQHENKIDPIYFINVGYIKCPWNMTL